MNGLYGWKPPDTSPAKRYLEQRDAEQIAAEAAVLTDRYKRSVAWLEKYHARGRKTAINWSPSITVTTTEETTSDEIHHQDHGAQAAEVGIAEGMGDATQECEAPGIAGRPDEPSDLRGQCGHEQPDEGRSRFAREGHTADFGDGDTPF